MPLIVVSVVIIGIAPIILFGVAAILILPLRLISVVFTALIVSPC
jgi:hypothetical protein